MIIMMIRFWSKEKTDRLKRKEVVEESIRYEVKWVDGGKLFMELKIKFYYLIIMFFTF